MAKSKGTPGTGQSEWDVFETQLLTEPPKGRAARARAAESPELEFDPAEREVLKRLAERSRLLRSRAQPLGNVVFLHGITGSDLAVARGTGAPASVWVNVLRLIRGKLSDLMLAGDGRQEAEAGLRVIPTGINKRFYSRAVLTLRAQWNVEPFAYDWRKDIDEASDALAELIQRRFGSQPVHLVAHSMGGLVARNMIRRHPAVWEGMRGADLSQGGRLVMLGTPNYGSFSIAQVLTGTDSLLQWLERFDLFHNLIELLRITNTFVGTYQLLPAFSKLPAALHRLYERDTWGLHPGVSQQHLNRTLEFHQALDTPETIDPTRMVYIAGTNQTTIRTLKIAAPGEFEYEFTTAGDGRVPHELGRLPGVPTWYAEELHGDLARNETILRALDEVLQTGSTEQLGTTPDVRGIVVGDVPAGRGSMRAYRSGADRAALEILEVFAARTRASESDDVLSEAEKQRVADALIHAALGARTPPLPKPEEAAPEPLPQAHRMLPESHRLQLKIGVRFGRIEDFEAPIVVVGHYRGVKPVNAIGAIDDRLKGWISRAVKRGMISGHLGETFFVPVNGALAAKGVVVAGMGEYGQFSRAKLEQLMANVAQGAAALQLPAVATLLIGAGEGSMDVDTALQSLIDGFCSGLLQLHAEDPKAALALKTLWIVEYDPLRFTKLGKKLENAVMSVRDRNVELVIEPPSAAERRRAEKEHERRAQLEFQRTQSASSSGDDSQPAFNEVRLTVEAERDPASDKEVFRLSALTRTAVVPARITELTRGRAESVSKALAEAQGRSEQDQYGRMLFNYLMPEDFQAFFGNNGDAPVRLVVDPTSAAIPWEMACFEDPLNPGTFRRLGTDRYLTRQFRTLLSRTPGTFPPRTEQVRVLVIADPAADPAWRLPGARAEGRRVATLLRNASRSRIEDGPVLDIVVEERIGYEQCVPIELLALLNSGDFDIVHFAGHGEFNADDPAKSGWVLDAGQYVTAADIFRARRVPWLIVANACYSGVVRPGEASYPSMEVARRGASIAEAFMERGVPNYLGTGWTVDDAQALSFATLFYMRLLENRRLGDAVAAAREALFAEPTGSTWGAYQFYGDPAERLIHTTGREPGRASAKK